MRAGTTIHFLQSFQEIGKGSGLDSGEGMFVREGSLLIKGWLTISLSRVYHPKKC